MRKSTTKNALLMSALSLFLCFAMLTGTTFAWFTDTVESGVNQIVAGNLDVELTHKSKNVAEETVAGATNLFSDIDAKKWEPNAMAMETFTVKNLGNLALKYELSLNVSDVTNGKDGTSFATALLVAVVRGTVADRAAAEAIAESEWKTLESISKAGDLMPTEQGGTPDEDTWTVIIWWKPSDNDNNFNMNNGATGEMSATIGVKLFATQLSAESDAFGPDYDVDATIKSTPVAIPTEDVTAPVTLTAADVAVEVPAAVINALPAGVTSIALNYTTPKVDTTANTVSFAAVELVDQNGNKIDLTNNTTPVAVTLPAQTAFAAGQDVVIMHDGVIVDTATVAADGSISYEANHFCEVVVSGCDEDVNGFVATAEALKAAVAAGGYYILSKDIDLDADETITVPAGVTVTLDLNGYTISSKNTRTATHNFLIDVKGGELTVKNGTVSYKHTGANMGWNGATTVIDVTAGGILNLENAVIENKGGTDMNFAVHLNNWGSVTLNADNCVFDAPYCSVRVFNSGPDMNNVTIENSKMTGATRAFWVHNYVSADFGGKVYSAATAAYDKAVVDARMNFDIFNNNNKFEISGEATSPIRYGFNSTVYYNAEGKQLVTATTLAEVMAYAKNGNVIIDAQGANLGDFYYNGTFGNGTVLKNAKFTYVYGASVDGVATFENCEFVSDHSYSANFSDGSYTGKVIFNDCYFDGWSSFGDAITGVEMNNCTFDWNNPYSMLRFYQNAVLNNCDFIAIDGIDTNKTGTVVKLNNCTGIEGKIYNNTENGVVKVGTWIVDGVVLTDVPAW